MKKRQIIGIILLMLSIVMVGCATKRIMKDCVYKSDNFFECEEP